MFGLSFRFPAGRYHATPWGRNVNEADVAWPPEPWRILRALIACYWRKGDRNRWSKDDLARLVDALAEDLPVFCLPEGAIHSHTRHYMPIPKGKSDTRTLIFDAFLHLPDRAEVKIVWQGVNLEGDLLDLAKDLASGMGYLGRAESWTECRVMTEVDGDPNCGPVELGYRGEPRRLLVPRSAQSYQAMRQRLIRQETDRLRESSRKKLTERALHNKAVRSFQARDGIDTLPASLVDALSVETADLQNRKWDQPPAAVEAVYVHDPTVNPGVVLRSADRFRKPRTESALPTVARYLLAGRPRPRIEDAVKIGEVMRAAALSKFGWETDQRTGKRFPIAPWKISGRDSSNRPVRDPTHPHAFWLPEDADGDGWIDHIVVVIAGGMDEEIQSRLDRITRIWLSQGGSQSKPTDEPNIDEWRLALEGFGHPEDFARSSSQLGCSRRWRSTTPFLASGHLKKAGHRGEAVRLLKRRGFETSEITINELREIMVGGSPRHTLNFHRFRSRGHERQWDSSGAFLEIEFPDATQGPLALGYACHFGLGMFGAV